MNDETKLKTQYTHQAATVFESRNGDLNHEANMHFYSILPPLHFGDCYTNWPRGPKRVLDAGCGEGSDMLYYRSLRANVIGIDSSPEMVSAAKKRGLDVVLGDFESLPFEEQSFDIILSKYAIQTSQNISLVLSEFGRVLKPGGFLQYITVHPMRQFIERKKPAQNYFEQTIVDSVLFDGKLTVQEPTHTMNEYLNSHFLKEFEITYFEEKDHFPASEQIGGQTYPCYLLLQARKRYE